LRNGFAVDPIGTQFLSRAVSLSLTLYPQIRRRWGLCVGVEVDDTLSASQGDLKWQDCPLVDQTRRDIDVVKTANSRRFDDQQTRRPRNKDEPRVNMGGTRKVVQGQ